METKGIPDNVEAVPLPTVDKATSPQSGWIWQRPEVIVPLAAWSLLCTSWLWHSLPFFLAIPVGCVLGFVLFFVTAVLFGDGPKTTIELGCGGTIGLILVFLLVPVFQQAREKARKQVCSDNVRALSQALLLYAQDNDGYLPKSDNWETASRPFVPATVGKKQRAVSLPIHCPTASGSVSYALYQPLAGSSLTSLTDAKIAPLVFDADVAVGTLEQLPEPGRHSGGNIIGYADGHVRLKKMTEAPFPAPKMYVRTDTSYLVANRPTERYHLTQYRTINNTNPFYRDDSTVSSRAGIVTPAPHSSFARRPHDKSNFHK